MSEWEKVGWITRLEPEEKPDSMVVERPAWERVTEDMLRDTLLSKPVEELREALVPHRQALEYVLGHTHGMPPPKDISRIIKAALEVVADELNMIEYEAIPVLGWKGPDSIQGYMPQQQYFVLGPDGEVIGSVGPGEEYDLDKLEVGKEYEAWYKES